MFKIKLKVDGKNSHELLSRLKEELGEKPKITVCGVEGVPVEIPIESDKEPEQFLEKIWAWQRVKRESGHDIYLELVTDKGSFNFDTLRFDEFKHQYSKQKRPTS